MKEKKGKLYFIALVPEGELYEEMMSLKNGIAIKYGSKAALKSPPHITLYMPFKWKEEKEKKLFDVLEEFSRIHEPVIVELKDFGSFKPRVIYIHVEDNESLNVIQKELIRALKTNLKIIDKGFEERPFRPHMTIAFRDLKKPMFFKAWEEEFKDKKFSASFTAHSIVLLKHNGKSWDIYKSYEMKGED